jgi:hypothetical protein
MANPMEVAELCMTGREFISVVTVAKYEHFACIPQDLNVKNADGVFTVIPVRRLRRWPLANGPFPPPPPPPGGPGGHDGPNGHR